MHLRWLPWLVGIRPSDPTLTAAPSTATTAEHVLLSLLPETERYRYHRCGELWVRGSAGGIYAIREGVAMNIYRLPSRECLCAHPFIESAPVASAMIAQVLMIRTDEPRFLDIAQPVH